jgi:hypothetical protein
VTGIVHYNFKTKSEPGSVTLYARSYDDAIKLAKQSFFVGDDYGFLRQFVITDCKEIKRNIFKDRV